MSFQETVEQKIIQETRRLVSPEAELEVCVKEDGSTCTIILKDNILTSKTLSDFRKMLDRVSEIISPAVQELTPMEQVAAEIMDAHAQARTAEAQARTAEILNAARNPGPQPSQPTPEPRPSRKRRLGLTGRVVDPLHDRRLKPESRARYLLAEATKPAIAPAYHNNPNISAQARMGGLVRAAKVRIAKNQPPGNHDQIIGTLVALRGDNKTYQEIATYLNEMAVPSPRNCRITDKWEGYHLKWLYYLHCGKGRTKDRTKRETPLVASLN